MDNRYIPRAVLDILKRKIKPQKVLILLGARRVGKTELIRKYLEEKDQGEYQFYNGEDQRTADLFAERSVTNYRRILGDQKLLVIDEAQKLPEVGLILKLVVDSIEGIQVVATGSSTFDLGNRLGEPLVGRANTLRIFPLAQMEFAPLERFADTKDKMEERLVFGGYPELEQLETWKEKMTYLDELVNSYLIRDILEFEGLRNSDKIMDLLRLIALQVGQEVSIAELASGLQGISRNTVERYLDLLSKVFIIYNVRGFSRNLRKEITKNSKWYFYDNGIRNAVIRNFNRLAMRMDQGVLWENYLMAERLKFHSYHEQMVNRYFWRTYDQQELDLVEEEAGQLCAYEFKWNPQKKAKVPGGWARAYPGTSFSVINTDHYLNFICK